MQSASEGFRYGQTPQEQRVLDAFKQMNLPAYSDHIVCFQCGGYFRNLSKGQYPHQCLKCGYHYDGALQHCMPDVIIPIEGKSEIPENTGVLYINGGIHGKEKVKKRDLHQIEQLRWWGYKILVMNNDFIDNAEVTWLRASVYSAYLMLIDSDLYSKMHRGEKELVGMGGIA